MAAPQYTAADFAAALQALLPRGQVWQRDPDTAQAATIKALAQVYEQQTQRANQLLDDAFPLTTYELLPEWETTLGLPDPCAFDPVSGASPTVAVRRAQVAARVKAQGGQSAAYFIALALALGYPITITHFMPARTGILRAGSRLNGEGWAHAWQINAPAFNVVNAAAGAVTAGEPLASWNGTVLICEMNALKPAHTYIVFHGPSGHIGQDFVIGSSALI